MPTISADLAIAVQHHQAGRWEAAAEVCRQIVAADPNQADALHLLGVIASQMGQHSLAIEYIQRAIELNGSEAAYHSNLAVAFQAQGRLDEAVASCRRVVALQPDNAVAHNNLGVVFKAQGKLEEALACFRRALQLRPDHAVALVNLGAALKAQGKLDEAADCFRRGLELRPDYAEAHNNLASIFRDRGNLDEAAACIRRAIELKPDYAVAHSNLGAVFQTQRKLDEAEASFRRAIELKSEYAEAHNSLGVALKDQGRLKEAIASFRRALELKPGFVSAYSNLLYTLWFSSEFDAAAIREEHFRFNDQLAAPLAQNIEPHTNDANPNRRLRVGYVSPNFRFHAQAFFLPPLFSAHDHQQFEIFCYSDVVLPDDVTAELRSYSDVWRVTNGLTDKKVAQLIRSDQIDILVDSTMHMSNGRPLLYARKPAPVQVCWLAYPGTTGLPMIDYRLTDSHLDPPGMNDRYYAEESIRLLDCFWCYRPLTNDVVVNSLPALSKGHVTFGCLNDFCKIHATVLELWAGVLNAVEGSRLMLLAPEGSARQIVLEILKPLGISADRITFIARQPQSTYMKLYHQIDIGLDTFPYNGHTTSLDSFWMGVPVITLVGKTVVGRAGLCQLHNLGLPELIADTPEQFIDASVRLSADLPRLSQLRAHLRGRLEQSPLMNAPRFARNMEAAYRGMWQRWCHQRSPIASA